MRFFSLGIFWAMVEKMFMVAEPTMLLSGKSFLNLSRASIFLAGSVILLASANAFWSGVCSRAGRCAAGAGGGVAGLACSAAGFVCSAGGALAGSGWAFSPGIASERKIAERIRAFISGTSNIGGIPVHPRAGRRKKNKNIRLSIFYHPDQDGMDPRGGPGYAQADETIHTATGKRETSLIILR